MTWQEQQLLDNLRAWFADTAHGFANWFHAYPHFIFLALGIYVACVIISGEWEHKAEMARLRAEEAE